MRPANVELRSGRVKPRRPDGLAPLETGRRKPLTDRLLDFIAATGTRRLRLRSDLYWDLCAELCRQDEWVASVNGVRVGIGTRRETREWFKP